MGYGCTGRAVLCLTLGWVTQGRRRQDHGRCIAPLPLTGYFPWEPRSPWQGEQPRTLRASLPLRGRNISDPEEQRNNQKSHILSDSSIHLRPPAPRRPSKMIKPSWHTSRPAPRLSYWV